MASLKSKYWVLMLKLMGKKRNRTSVEAFYQDIEKRRKSDRYQPPKDLAQHFTVTETSVDGFPVITLKEKSISVRQHLFYLHGGAYVGEILPQQWEFIAHLAARTHAEVVVPIYPLAPEHKAAAVQPFVQKVYHQLEERLQGMRLHVIGDSAGAGLAVALAQAERAERGAFSAHQLLLVSPWVDVSMDNPDIAAIEASDPWLTQVGLAEAGRCYAGDWDVKDPRISPTFGKLDGLPKTHIMMGTRDILLPDAKLFADKLGAAGVPYSFRQYEGMFHCWVMLDMPETREAREEMIGLLQS
ncbi:alpha/beta hydrolase fold domain-containing protein [Kordiimonas sp.]|uniref:alpha/beta hydrolase fold domain-containing protein n=1 Tax=Kordiimonas sp. TaxID=1970157 RepID=UPI003A8E7644